jgi:membrane protease YdiL (CAAX protease family)
MSVAKSPREDAMDLGLRRSPRIALLLAVVLVAVDFYLALRRVSLPLRGAALIPVAFWMGERNRWSLSSLGLRLRPRQSVRYWAVAMAAIGLSVGVICAAFLAVNPDFWRTLVIYGEHYSLPGKAREYLIFAMVEAPLGEEGIYRFALVNLMLPTLGDRKTVLLDGLAFGALHAAYGKLAPDNAVAGFFFAWSYIKSGSLAVPIVLHAMGNLMWFLICRGAAWYSGAM